MTIVCGSELNTIGAETKVSREKQLIAISN